jgi:hypothetical protein
MEQLLVIALVVIAIYCAIKLVGFAIKAGFLLLALGLVYWLVAPMLGLPLP